MRFQMLWGRKRILLYGLLVAVLLISIIYLLLPSGLKLFYVLDTAYLAETEPQGTIRNMTCPQCGLQLERIVIDPSEPQIMDEPWRDAYYCVGEDIFWVADCPGLFFAGWYGPFDAHFFGLRDTIAGGLVIISGVVLVVLAMRDRGLMKRKLK